MNCLVNKKKKTARSGQTSQHVVNVVFRNVPDIGHLNLKPLY